MKRKRLSVLALVCLLAVTLAGCGGTSGPSSGHSVGQPAGAATARAPGGGGAVTISTATVSGLGPALVDAQGRTLYIFVPDEHAKVTCVSTCAQLWPPVKLTPGTKPAASGLVKPALLGSDPDPEGARVVTYSGWPLYTYVGDSGAGTASGQGLRTNGGLWYAISPSGRTITTTP